VGYIEPMVIGTYFGDSIVVRPEHAAMSTLREEWHGIGAFIQHGLLSLPFWLAIAGIVAAWYCYLVNPALPERLKRAAGPIYTLLDQKYYFDRFNDWFFAGGARAMGYFLSTVGDRAIIDGFFVNGTARVVGWTAVAGAPRPVRLRLSLRLHDDPRRLRVAHLVDAVRGR
jgi:NADH-quinone oxidoreductase subunit L